MHISSVIEISFCRISFSGHQNKFCACLDSIYGSRVMCKNCSDIRWHRLNSNQSKTNCPKNLNSDGLIVREMGPWPECIFRSLLQFLVIFDFHILPEHRRIGDKIFPCRCISIKNGDQPWGRCWPIYLESKPSLNCWIAVERAEIAFISIHINANQNSYHDDKSIL